MGPASNNLGHEKKIGPRPPISFRRPTSEISTNHTTPTLDNMIHKITALKPINWCHQGERGNTTGAQNPERSPNTRQQSTNRSTHMPDWLNPGCEVARPLHVEFQVSTHVTHAIPKPEISQNFTQAPKAAQAPSNHTLARRGSFHVTNWIDLLVFPRRSMHLVITSGDGGKTQTRSLEQPAPRKM